LDIRLKYSSLFVSYSLEKFPIVLLVLGVCVAKVVVVFYICYLHLTYGEQLTNDGLYFISLDKKHYPVLSFFFLYIFVLLRMGLGHGAEIFILICFQMS